MAASHTTTPQEGPCESCVHVGASLQPPAPSNLNASTSCLCATSRLSRRIVRKRRRKGSSGEALDDALWFMWRGRCSVVVRVGERIVSKRRRQGSSNEAILVASWLMWRCPDVTSRLIELASRLRWRRSENNVQAVWRPLQGWRARVLQPPLPHLCTLAHVALLACFTQHSRQ